MEDMDENATRTDLDVSNTHEGSSNINRYSAIQNAIQSFSFSYQPVFGYLAIFICVLSVIANSLNIIILTRKGMVTPANTFLLGLSVSDGLKVALYIPWILQAYIIHGTTLSPERNTEAFARYLHFWATSSIVIHSISVWLTVTLALFRYLCIHFPKIHTQFGNVKSARIAVVTVSVFSTALCIPNSIMFKVKRTKEWAQNMSLNNSNVSIWILEKLDDGTQRKLNFWIQAIFIRLLPCLLLMVFTILLVRTITDANKTRVVMTVNNTFSVRTQRTTKMLLSVVVLFLLTETPHGILILLSGVIEDFFKNFYIPLGDVIDTLALLNDGITFVLYCTMSKQFRRKFILLFCRCYNIKE